MPDISFETDITALSKELPEWAQVRIPSITRNALNDTVDDARFAEVARIEGVFDRPTPFTQKGVLYTRATKETLTATVFLRDEASGNGNPPARYLGPEVRGGARGAKGFERRLRAAGVMRGDEFAIPAIGQPRDAYGNLPRGLLNRVLSQLQAAGGVGYLANETARSRKRNPRSRASRYFVVSDAVGGRQDRGIGRLPRGVYERRGRSIRAVLIFVSGAPSYRRRYPFGQAAIAKAERVFGAYWTRYFYAELAKQTTSHRAINATLMA